MRGLKNAFILCYFLFNRWYSKITGGVWVAYPGASEEILENPELLREHNLDIPPLAELFLSLGLPVLRSLEEGRKQLEEWGRG